MAKQEDEFEQSAQHEPSQSPLGSLPVFKDQPLFADVVVGEEADAFNHAAFAQTILDLIKRNDPPLSIGLFGAWGIGKSTIINILFGKLREFESESFKPIYFNAWKYSGDSFRRQFLIEAARQVYGDDHDEVSRLTRLNYVDVLKRHYQKGLAHAIGQAIKDTAQLKFALRGGAIVRFALGCASLLVLTALAGLVFAEHPIIATLLLTMIAPAIFVWFSQIKFEDLVVFQEAPLYDPKLIFPEQFEAEFSSLINSKALKGKKAVIAIDDLDRCDLKMVQDVLISMKNFIGQEKCFFIVPCDDKTIVAVFNEPNQRQGYADESLRKYFNVVLRIPPITSTDLVDFANTMARKTGIPEDVIQVAVLANCRDARKMKHFLNSLAMKYQIAKAREAAGLMPEIVDESLLELAKAVLIEDAYPTLFSKIVENPRVYQVLERAALGVEDDTGELKALKLDKWSDDYPGLKEVLERTRDIPMVHADVFFSLKTTNPEVKIPRGTELKTAIIGGTSAAIDEIAKGITDATARTAVADLLVDLLNKSTGRFLQRSITAALKLYDADLFSENDRRRIANSVSSALLHRDTVGILSQRPNAVLRAAEESGNAKLFEMLEKYHRAISDIKTPKPPDNIIPLITSIFKVQDQRTRFADLFNGKFDTWISTQEGIAALETLDLPSDVATGDRIPSPALTGKILEAISPDSSEMSNNEIRRKILFSNWNEGYAGPFIKTLTAILQRNVGSNIYGPDIRFAIESINLRRDLVAAPDATTLWSALPPLYDRITDSTGKHATAKAAAAFAVFSGDPNVRSASKTFLLAFWRTLSDPSLRESLTFIGSLDPDEGSALKRAAIEQEMATIGNERQAPTDRTAQRLAMCLDFADLLGANAIPDVLVAALEVTPNEPLKKWTEIIKINHDRLGAAVSLRIANRCIELVRTGNYEQSRSQILLEALADSIDKVSPEMKVELIASYFTLLKSPNANARNAAATALSGISVAISDRREINIRVGNVLGDLRREVTTNDLGLYRPVIDALLTQKDAFGESEWDEVAGLSKRLLPEANPQLQEFGMALVEQMPTIPEASREELMHLLLTVEKSSQALRERASEVLMRNASSTPGEPATDRPETEAESL